MVFCVSRKGWGWDNFLAEADAGAGMKFPRWARGCVPHSCPKGIWLNTLGRVTNTSEGPWSGATAKAKQAGKMMRPARMGTSLGLQKGVERITKVMMIALLGVMALLVVRSVTLPGAAEGLEFYLHRAGSAR